jgi:hypothetical protein
MHTRQRGDWLTSIHVGGDPCAGIEIEVDLAARDRVGGRVRNVADIGEALRA